MNAFAKSAPLPATAFGVGLKPAHYAEILATRPVLGFFEIHAENYMADGGPAHRWLSRLRELYPLSLHGVGLSLGSAEPLDRAHLARLARLERLYRPALVSEHLAWCSFSGAHFPDLLPLPYDETSLRRTVEKVAAVQEALGRTILIENPATYLRFAAQGLAEPQFLDELSARTGCGLLLDVNNVHVAATNHGFGADRYFDAFPLHRVGEIHLAGSAETSDAQGKLLIDDHGSPVSPEVWNLYEQVLRRAGPLPTLIEWDNNVPDFPLLLAEAEKAAAVQGSVFELTEGLSERHGRACPGHPRRAEAIGMGHLTSPVPPPSTEAVAPAWMPGTSPDMTDWRDGQEQFSNALRDPTAPVPGIFAPCDTQARFAVYRNNSAIACREALKQQFPSVLLLIGDEAFAGLARAFWRDDPPRSPVLGEYGGGFADFLETLPEVARQTPYLADLARLDWACLAALRADDAAPAALDALAALDPARIGAARATLHPSLALIASDWPLLALRDSAEKPVEDWSGGAVAIVRPHGDLRVVPCPAATAAFLKCLMRGASLGEAAEQAGSDFDFGAGLVDLVQFGAFTRFSEGSEP